MAVASPVPSYTNEPKPYPKPELSSLHEVRGAGNSINKDNGGGGNVVINKPESVKAVKAASINEDAEKEPVIKDILEIFDGEVLNRK